MTGKLDTITTVQLFGNQTINSEVFQSQEQNIECVENSITGYCT